ncbi:unnamed protein product [Symbiodinium sp. KB8]|nr:unnamed protein product [Symbiodinium sp. KB8]
MKKPASRTTAKKPATILTRTACGVGNDNLDFLIEVKGVEVNMIAQLFNCDEGAVAIAEDPGRGRVDFYASDSDGGAEFSDSEGEVFFASDAENEKEEQRLPLPAQTSRRAYRERASDEAVFLGKPVCRRALSMLLGVGQSTLQNLRRGLPIGTQKQRQPRADKHPLLGVSMNHSPTVKWAGVLMFLWLVYHSEAEYLPTHFRAGCGSHKLAEEAFPDPVDNDQSLRSIESFMKSLHKHYADVEEHMIGPGSFSGARKVLPHGSRTELYWSYRAWVTGTGKQKEAASFNTFLRVANKVLRIGEKDGVLKFRKQNEHGACDTCTGLKTDIRKAVRQFGVHSPECETAQRAYTRHLLSQWLDRQVYWSMRSLSQAWFKQSAEFGHRALVSSVATAVATVIQDGMDQSKFKVPRTRLAPSKLFQRLFRPTLHVAASWLHGRAIYFYVSDEDSKKDGAAQLEMLSRTLNSIADNLPMGLCLQQDNTYREGKNRFIMNYLCILVGLGVFRWTVASFLRTGHRLLAPVGKDLVPFVSVKLVLV